MGASRVCVGELLSRNSRKLAFLPFRKELRNRHCGFHTNTCVLFSVVADSWNRYEYWENDDLRLTCMDFGRMHLINTKAFLARVSEVKMG